MGKRITIDTTKTVLSSILSVYKTEKFMFETVNFADSDTFIDKLFGGILLNLDIINEKSADLFKLQTLDREHSFYFHKSQTQIVFFRYKGREAFYRYNDRSLSNILKQESFSVDIERSNIEYNQADFKKLYRLSNSPKVSFPLLNEKQKSIVAIEDQNVLVQGVAGSGKTNLCIDKIVFSACRGYRGKVLYTTFSRGLLIDTQNKLNLFKNNLKDFTQEYSKGNIIFADKDHKKAIKKRFGIYFAEDNNDDIVFKINKIVAFLENNVDYLLLEDIYARYINEGSVVLGENLFKRAFLKDLKNHQLLSKLERTSRLSPEVIFKEIYGVIFGLLDLDNTDSMLSLEQYIEKRQDSFNKSECEIIYFLAKDYLTYLEKNDTLDNNLICRRLLKIQNKIARYSLAIIDEAQDMTQINLFFIKSISAKMFCLGDALQMINPSYFSFAYLKRLMFEKDIINVAELSANYRSSLRIAQAIEKLGELNMRLFGTHSFALKTISVENDTPSSLIYLSDNNFINAIKDDIFNNYTIIVSDSHQKENLKRVLKRQEILTVSEVKGLERGVIILYNILSSNADKLEELERITINRKKADENSVYRYYFNLFYVGLSRGKSHIFVVEDKKINYFTDYFAENFEKLRTGEAIKVLTSTSDKTEAEQDELLARIEEFIKLGQYDNARFNAEKLISERERDRGLSKIDIYERLVSKGSYYDAGIAFWEQGLLEEAKKQFTLTNDEQLIKLIDASIDNDSNQLNIGIVDFIADVLSNKTAFNLILETIKKDYSKLVLNSKEISVKAKQTRKTIGDRG